MPLHLIGDHGSPTTIALGRQRAGLYGRLGGLLLSLLGGMLGIALGFTASTVIDRLVQDLTPVVDIGTVLMSFSFAAAVGLVFGIYPAWRAANLRPIEALRYE